jgi:hypothetical protein
MQRNQSLYPTHDDGYRFAEPPDLVLAEELHAKLFASAPTHPAFGRDAMGAVVQPEIVRDQLRDRNHQARARARDVHNDTRGDRGAAERGNRPRPLQVNSSLASLLSWEHGLVWNFPAGK